MVVNEAPWLTRWIEALLVVAVFLICCTADMLKCNNGFTYKCSDNGYRTCRREPQSSFCDDLVLPTTVMRELRRCSCEDRKFAELLLHVVEVGAPIAAGGSGGENIERIPLAPLLSNALRGSIGDKIVGNRSSGIFRVPVLEALRKEIGLTVDNSTPCLNSESTFKVFHSHDSVLVPGSVNLLEEVKAAIPFDDGGKSMPGIRSALEELLKRRQQPNEPGASSCMFAHLIFIVVGTPGRGGVWSNNESDTRHAALQLMEVQAHIRRTISRFLRGKRRYTGMLGTVWYVGVPVGFPVHNNSATDGRAAENGRTRSCDVGDGLPRCTMNCTAHTRRLTLYKSVNGELERMVGSHGRRLSARTIILPYNDYFSTIGNLPGESQWVDCFTLSSGGVAEMARLLVEGL
ncbi:hypothetical protein, conserved [Trypanosoma brucei brucei TREU927]|uniref:Uncharacterized protein n=1 Tax=Trypanosoma brucei brucei (strain 927/4 GUTat10.1) TaxID=185431 RepID=Q57WQ2_TRYB2|nr:hypothetical protein, conserved [Trypanosoma brucei brucei TREU927]AAX69940.1 hypothetical protein, conserved [Trypanosoma brucei]AAZ12213.1 hypothetical protein, conserved [Trypanosoma brucei brucei TREU927]